MISFLIACYDQNILNLVTDISFQGKSSGVDFEVIAHDNGEDKNLQSSMENQLSHISQFKYWCNQSDSTRSASRNWLASQARFNNLVFIDGDASVVDDQFFNRYQSLIPTKKIWVGGTAYHNSPPETKRRLRWAYGIEREMLTAEKRKEQHYYGFSSFNFMISKEIFDQVGFDENIQAYGHEDTLLGQELLQQGFEIDHLDNPLFHDGLDENHVFLEKSEIGIRTMVELKESGKLEEDTRLYSMFLKLDRFKMLSAFRAFFKVFENRIHENLNGPSPNMKLFDIWKLGKLCEIA